MNAAHERARQIGPHVSWQIVAPSDDHDLVSDPVDFKAGSFTLQNHQGPTIPRPKLVIVRVGPTWWGDFDRFTQFCDEMMTRGYLDKLTYAGYVPGSGQFVGAYEGDALGGGTYTDAQVQQYLRQQLAANKVPQPGGDKSFIYSLMFPQNVTISLSGELSCQAFCGYHSALSDGTVYTVQTFSGCQGCNQGDPFVGATMVEAHEVAESQSDPYGTGFFEDSTGRENADCTAWLQLPYGPWVVQGYGSPDGQNLVGDYGQASQPPPQQPPPSDDPHAADLAAANAVVSVYAAQQQSRPHDPWARQRLAAATRVRDAVAAVQG